MLRLAEKAFYPAKIPFPILQVDTGLDFPEVMETRDRWVDRLGVQLVVASIDDAIAKGVVTEDGKTYYSSSASIVFSDMLRLMLRDSPLAIGVTLTVVFLIVLIDFKRLRPALLVMFPLLCGGIWMCGVMYVFGMKLNFYNMVALPTIIGMGIDNGVHLYHRYREEGPGSLTLILRSWIRTILI